MPNFLERLGTNLSKIETRRIKASSKSKTSSGNNSNEYNFNASRSTTFNSSEPSGPRVLETGPARSLDDRFFHPSDRNTAKSESTGSIEFALTPQFHREYAELNKSYAEKLAGIHMKDTRATRDLISLPNMPTKATWDPFCDALQNIADAQEHAEEAKAKLALKYIEPKHTPKKKKDGKRQKLKELFSSKSRKAKTMSEKGKEVDHNLEHEDEMPENDDPIANHGNLAFGYRTPAGSIHKGKELWKYRGSEPFNGLKIYNGQKTPGEPDDKSEYGSQAWPTVDGMARCDESFASYPGSYRPNLRSSMFFVDNPHLANTDSDGEGGSLHGRGRGRTHDKDYRRATVFYEPETMETYSESYRNSAHVSEVAEIEDIKDFQDTEEMEENPLKSQNERISRYGNTLRPPSPDIGGVSTSPQISHLPTPGPSPVSSRRVNFWPWDEEKTSTRPITPLPPRQGVTKSTGGTTSPVLPREFTSPLKRYGARVYPFEEPSNVHSQQHDDEELKAPDTASLFDLPQKTRAASEYTSDIDEFSEGELEKIGARRARQGRSTVRYGGNGVSRFEDSPSQSRYREHPQRTHIPQLEQQDEDFKYKFHSEVNEKPERQPTPEPEPAPVPKKSRYAILYENKLARLEEEEKERLARAAQTEREKADTRARLEREKSVSRDQLHKMAANIRPPRFHNPVHSARHMKSEYDDVADPHSVWNHSYRSSPPRSTSSEIKPVLERIASPGLQRKKTIRDDKSNMPYYRQTENDGEDLPEGACSDTSEDTITKQYNNSGQREIDEAKVQARQDAERQKYGKY
ncbi:hypothetical protein EDC01DRAFT_635199 [Geopyxis carbonaria]|nr:hypothetical protein EDC01DRAFT_635199 [Geopyxis carbonaria]